MNAGTARRYRTGGSTGQYASYRPAPEARRYGGEEVQTGFGGFNQTHARIAVAQGAAHFSTELVPCLRGVPARCPCERDLRTRRRRLVVPFHGEGEHGVFILRLARFVHADIGAHRGTAAVTVRFTRQFLAANAEARFRRGIFNACQLRQFFHHRVDNVVELRPVHFTALHGAVQECSQRQLSSITVLLS